MWTAVGGEGGVSTPATLNRGRGDVGPRRRHATSPSGGFRRRRRRGIPAAEPDSGGEECRRWPPRAAERNIGGGTRRQQRGIPETDFDGGGYGERGRRQSRTQRWKE
nr:unnamed protein product [Digitaria exilis]